MRRARALGGDPPPFYPTSAGNTSEKVAQVVPSPGRYLARWRGMAEQGTLDLRGCNGSVMACRRVVDAPHRNLTDRRMRQALDPPEHQAHGRAGRTRDRH